MDRIYSYPHQFKRHLLGIAYAFKARAIPVLICGALFSIIGNQLYYAYDKHSYDVAPDSQFVDYYDFTVNNAREGENVFFKVCRKHDKNYHYTGTLTVYIVPNTNNPKDNIKVYSKGLEGTLNPGDCENKVLKASNFHQSPGNYVMRFNIEIKVKYGITKQGFKESNVYTIYPQPTDLQAQIKYYQNIISQLQKPTSTADTSGSMAIPAQMLTTNNTSTTTNTTVVNSGNTQTPAEDAPPLCNLPLLGKIICP